MAVYYEQTLLTAESSCPGLLPIDQRNYIMVLMIDVVREPHLEFAAFGVKCSTFSAKWLLISGGFCFSHLCSTALVSVEMSEIIFFVITAVCFVIGCLQIYGFHRFRSLRHFHPVQKRWPKLVQFECIACILSLFIGVPSLTNVELNVIKNGFTHTAATIMTVSPRILNTSLAHFIIDIEACRLYLMSYSLHYLSSSKNCKWKSQIDHSFAEKDWYLRNKHKFGNPRYVIKRVGIYYVLSTAITVSAYTYARIVHLEYLYIADLTNAVLFIIPVAVINFTYYKTPSQCNDNLYFYFEYRITALVVSTGFIIYVSGAVVESIGFILMGFVLSMIASVYTLSVPSILSVVVIPFKIEHEGLWGSTIRPRGRGNAVNSQWSHQNSKPTLKGFGAMTLSIDSCTNNSNTETSRSMSMSDFGPTLRVPSQTTDAGARRLSTTSNKLRETLLNEAEFGYFVDWMYREFSSEVMLSFIELVQFNKYLMSFVEREHPDLFVSADDIHRDIRFYDGIPRSTIVFGAKNMNSKRGEGTDRGHGLTEVTGQWDCMVAIADALHEKYIRTAAEFEINISSNLRSSWFQMDARGYPEDDVLQLLSLLSNTIAEMLKYIRQSFIRFAIDRR